MPEFSSLASERFWLSPSPDPSYTLLLLYWFLCILLSFLALCLALLSSNFFFSLILIMSWVSPTKDLLIGVWLFSYLIYINCSALTTTSKFNFCKLTFVLFEIWTCKYIFLEIVLNYLVGSLFEIQQHILYLVKLWVFWQIDWSV